MHTPPIMEKPQSKDFYRKLLSSASLNPFTAMVSPSRLQMFCASHLAQKITCAGMNERYTQTGMEQEFGKSTFSVKMPCDGKILQLLHLYPQGIGIDAVQENPETVVLFENIETKEVGMLLLPRYFSYHSYFGFPYQHGKGMKHLVVGAIIPKDTILLDSPGKTEHGNYAYGVQLNTVFMSHPAISEDGIVISRDALEKFSFKRYETRSVEWGDKKFALNLFGKPGTDEYKICPEIGEYVRDDGLLMALRTFDETLVPVDMNVHALRKVDFAHDERIYANGPGGKVIDIRVTTNFDISEGLSNMDAQLEKYISLRRKFQEELIRTYRRFKANKGLQISRELHALLVRSMNDLATGADRRTKLYRKTPIDRFRVDFVIEYNVVPSIGFKFTGCSGD